MQDVNHPSFCAELRMSTRVSTDQVEITQPLRCTCRLTKLLRNLRSEENILDYFAFSARYLDTAPGISFPARGSLQGKLNLMTKPISEWQEHRPLPSTADHCGWCREIWSRTPIRRQPPCISLCRRALRVHLIMPVRYREASSWLFWSPTLPDKGTRGFYFWAGPKCQIPTNQLNWKSKRQVIFKTEAKVLPGSFPWLLASFLFYSVLVNNLAPFGRNPIVTLHFFRGLLFRLAASPRSCSLSCLSVTDCHCLQGRAASKLEIWPIFFFPSTNERNNAGFSPNFRNFSSPKHVFVFAKLSPTRTSDRETMWPCVGSGAEK